MKLPLISKIFLSLSLLAVFSIAIVNFLPLHLQSSGAHSKPCLFEIVTRTECTKNMGDLESTSYHLGSISDTFTATPTSADLLLAAALIIFGLAPILHWGVRQVELYTQTAIKQKWKDGQSIEKLFNPIKVALRSGILERKEPSLVIA